MSLKSAWRALRPFGLRWGRLREWHKMLREDGAPRLTVDDWAKMAALCLKHFALLAVHRGMPDGARERIRADFRVCLKCAFHDREFNRCLLCGCSMPLKLAAGGGCAAKEIDPESTTGF